MNELKTGLMKKRRFYRGGQGVLVALMLAIVLCIAAAGITYLLGYVETAIFWRFELCCVACGLAVLWGISEVGRKIRALDDQSEYAENGKRGLV